MDAPFILYLAWSFSVVTFIVYLFHMIERTVSNFKSPSPETHTLYLRRLKQSGAEMMKGSETRNVFLDEFNLLADLLYPKLDFAVMKALGTDIPLVTKQEHQHAKMHNQAQAERKRLSEPLRRWGWVIYLADMFLLRLGREITCGMCGFVEATSEIWLHLYMALPFNKGLGNNEAVFHAMEEVEHGPLTTQYLRAQIHILTPLFLLPIAVFLYTALFLLPPVVVLLAHPSFLLSRKTYFDFAKYYCTFVPVLLATIVACVAYWVLPYNIGQHAHQYRYDFFLDTASQRGIQFEIINKYSYKIRGGKVSSGLECS